LCLFDQRRRKKEIGGGGRAASRIYVFLYIFYFHIQNAYQIEQSVSFGGDKGKNKLEQNVCERVFIVSYVYFFV